MDVNTGEFVDTSDPTKDTYVVGGEPDIKGNKIREKVRPQSELADPAHFSAHVNRIRKATGGRLGASLGAWTKGKKVVLDASSQEPDLNRAMMKAEDRNEEAVWSSKKFRESGNAFDGDIANPNFDPSKKKKK